MVASRVQHGDALRMLHLFRSRNRAWCRWTVGSARTLPWTLRSQVLAISHWLFNGIWSYVHESLACPQTHDEAKTRHEGNKIYKNYKKVFSVTSLVLDLLELCIYNGKIDVIYFAKLQKHPMLQTQYFYWK